MLCRIPNSSLSFGVAFQESWTNHSTMWPRYGVNERAPSSAYVSNNPTAAFAIACPVALGVELLKTKRPF